MTDKMKTELKMEMLKDLIGMYNACNVHTTDRKIIEKQILRYESTLKWFEKYNAETWDEVEQKIKEKEERA